MYFKAVNLMREDKHFVPVWLIPPQIAPHLPAAQSRSHLIRTKVAYIILWLTQNKHACSYLPNKENKKKQKIPLHSSLNLLVVASVTQPRERCRIITGNRLMAALFSLSRLLFSSALHCEQREVKYVFSALCPLCTFHAFDKWART